MFTRSLLVSTLLASSVTSQTLNTWRQQVFQICCSSWDSLIDGDPSTYDDPYGNEITLLHNTRETYLGFYIRSSANYITDVEVSYYSPFYQYITAGRGTSSQEGWLAVALYNEDGEPGVRSSSFTITINSLAGTNDTETRINEIYPIYPGDEIVFPPGSGSQPPPWNPVKSEAPTPKAPGLYLNHWPEKPRVADGSSDVALFDRNPDTSFTQALSPDNFYSVSWMGPVTLKGFYVLSGSEQFLTGYHVLSIDAYTRETKEICRVEGAIGNFTVCPFHDLGDFFYSREFNIYPDAVKNGGETVHINEIWPIFAGEEIVDPKTVDVYAQR